MPRPWDAKNFGRYHFEPMFASCGIQNPGQEDCNCLVYGWGDGEWMQNWEETCKNDGASLARDSVICNETPDDEARKQTASTSEKALA